MISRSIVFIVGNASKYVKPKDVDQVLFERVETVLDTWSKKHGVKFECYEYVVNDIHKQYITVNA